jgi:hypothetical protein
MNAIDWSGMVDWPGIIGAFIVAFVVYLMRRKRKPS